MSNHNVTNHTLSLLDMLCAAMGGVALLVFLFAAMQKNMEIQAEGSSQSMTLRIDTQGMDTSDPFYIGKHIMFCIICDNGNGEAFYQEGVGTGGFEIVSENAHAYRSELTALRFHIKGDISRATIVVWLQHFAPAKQETFLRNGGQITYTLLRGEDVLIQPIRLLRANNFYSEPESFEVPR